MRRGPSSERATSLSRLRELGESMGPATGPAEALAEAASSKRGRRELLVAAAGNPELTPAELARLAVYRMENGVSPTEPLIEEQLAAQLGARLPAGAQGVAVLSPETSAEGGGVSTRLLFAPSMFATRGKEALSALRGPAAAGPPSTPEEVALLADAAEEAGLEDGEPISDHIFSLRYGLVAPDAEMPPLPADAGALDVAMRGALSRVCAACELADRAAAESFAAAASGAAQVGGARRAPSRPARPDTFSMTTASIRRALEGLRKDAN